MIPIGQTAKHVNLPVKTVRYYDNIGLVTPQDHTEKGYRLYGKTEIQKLIFVKNARQFGFTIKECQELLGLYENSARNSSEVKKIASQHLDKLRTQMGQLQNLMTELEYLSKACQDNSRPACPILDSLAVNRLVAQNP